MVEIVNGYVCFNCSDTAKAQKGVDPAHPDGDPLKPAARAKKTHQAAELALTPRSTRVHASGHLARIDANGTVRELSGAPDPTVVTPAALSAPAGALLPPGLGGQLDLTA